MGPEMEFDEKKIKEVERQIESKTSIKLERYRSPGKMWGSVFVFFSFCGVVFSINEIFQLGIVYHEFVYYYGMVALFLSISFLVFPISKAAPKDRVPWYDILLFLTTIACCVYLMVNSFRISNEGWVTVGPKSAIVVSILMWGIVLEALRRSGGLALLFFAGIFSIYPLFAEYMPGFLEGTGWSLAGAAKFHVMTRESIIGIPTMTFCQLVIGFMLFSSALQATGGGLFFTKFAYALLGGVRGGPAKVSVVASSLFGTISGSAVANVVVDGWITIPTMVKAGYEPEFAAAVEACASSGGCIMPPVMGAVAFVMASFLNVPYAAVALAAVVPALLYYWGLFVQIDGHAAKRGLLGMSKSEIPSLKETLKQGWIYLFSLVTLVYLLFVLKQEAQAPYIASLVLLISAMFRKETRLKLKGFYDLLLNSGLVLTEMVAILAGVGLIMGGASMTGLSVSFTSELIHLAGGNTLLVLIMGAVVSYILGMGMTITACYIFLAIILVPAITPLGLDTMAVHMFVLYCGLFSFITPPVALAAYVAAVIGGANFWKTGLQSMRLGVVKYLVPFFFVYDPALILHGSDPLIIFIKVIKSFFGVWILGSAIEGYLMGIGTLSIAKRIIYLISGFLLFYPGWISDVVGFVLFVIMFAPDLIMQRSRKSTYAVDSTKT